MYTYKWYLPPIITGKKKILANSTISESLIKNYALSLWYSSQPNHSKWYGFIGYIKGNHSGIKSNHVLLVPHYIQANGQLFKSH